MSNLMTLISVILLVMYFTEGPWNYKNIVVGLSLLSFPISLEISFFMFLLPHMSPKEMIKFKSMDFWKITFPFIFSVVRFFKKYKVHIIYLSIILFLVVIIIVL